MEEQKKGLFDLLDRKQAFILGIVGAFLVICSVGFFILLAIMLSGGSFGNGSTTTASSGPKKFSACLDTNKYASVIEAQEQEGAQLGVQGTPATFINGYLIGGAYPFEAVKTVVDALLADKVPQWDTKTYGELTKVNMPNLTDAVWKGKDNAKITIVEYADFECPYCVRFHSTMKQVLDTYGDQIKFTFRHFPLSFHTNAKPAAQAYECAKEQGKGFEMYEKLFTLSGNGQLNIDSYKKTATELGLK